MSMTDTTETAAHSAFRVLAALAELGEATAANIAEQAELGYSTTTPKLRAWEDTGQAERFRTDEGRTLWRLTASGRAATAPTGTDTAVPANAGQPDGPAPAASGVPGEPDHPGGPEPDTIPTPTTADAPSDTNLPATPYPDTTPADTAVVPTTATDTFDRSAAPSAVAVNPGPGPSRQPETRRRRSKGSLGAAILDIYQAHPGQQFKVGELCRLIDDANAGSGAAKVSQGAVYNAATKLAAAGTLIQTVDKPATFQLTRSGD